MLSINSSGLQGLLMWRQIIQQTNILPTASMHLSYSWQCPNPFLISPTTLPLQTLNTIACFTQKHTQSRHLSLWYCSASEKTHFLWQMKQFNLHPHLGMCLPCWSYCTLCHPPLNHPATQVACGLVLALPQHLSTRFHAWFLDLLHHTTGRHALAISLQWSTSSLGSIEGERTFIDKWTSISFTFPLTCSQSCANCPPLTLSLHPQAPASTLWTSALPGLTFSPGPNAPSAYPSCAHHLHVFDQVAWSIYVQTCKPAASDAY